jgi:hypothetical protein
MVAEARVVLRDRSRDGTRASRVPAPTLHHLHVPRERAATGSIFCGMDDPPSHMPAPLRLVIAPATAHDEEGRHE